ncbi:MAG TPA: hypothetical protein VMC42_06265 [Methanoregulaceae archaeon]|nr:hypothetical protein [Methanoregulaceae archaeon]
MIKVNLVADMDCNRCGRPAVIFQPYSGLSFCAHHLVEDIRKKGKRTVRLHSWIRPGDRIAFPCTGDPHSIALTDFVRALVNGRKDISTCPIGPGKHEKIGSRSVSEQSPHPDTDPGFPAGLHGRGRSGGSNDPFRTKNDLEYSLCMAAKRNNATVLAMPYTLEDHAEWALWKAVCGEIPGPERAGRERKTGIRIIRPFMHIPAPELTIYGETVAGTCAPGAIRCDQSSQESFIGRLLEEFSLGHPGARFAFVNIWDDITDLARQQGDTPPEER